MRDLPWLTTDIAARATQLSAKALDARRTNPGVPDPKASITPARVVDGKATIRLYDYIDSEGGYWGISAEEFAQALDEAGDVTEIELRVNSGGGSVWDGIAMLNVLRDHDATVTAIVDGVAASAASFIAVACDRVVMMPNARLMIHDAMGICMGQAVDMREYADFLDSSSDNIAEVYAEKAGGTTEEWRARMTAKGLLGEWFSAQQAKDEGLVDEVWAKAADQPEDRTELDQKVLDAMNELNGLKDVKFVVEGDQLVAVIKKAEKATTDPDAAKAAEMGARYRATQHQLAAERHGFTAA